MGCWRKWKKNKRGKGNNLGWVMMEKLESFCKWK